MISLKSFSIVLIAIIFAVVVVDASIPTKSVLRISEITEDKLAPKSISSSKIQRHAVGTGHVQDAAITSDKIGRYAVNERHISPNSITAKSLAVEEITILLRANDYFLDENQYQFPLPKQPDIESFVFTPTTPIHPARTLLKPQDQRLTGIVENHYVSPNGFYYARGRASGPGIILGWYPSLNGHLLRYQADRALRDISCNAVHTRDQYVRKMDYNMVDYTSLATNVQGGTGYAIQPDFTTVTPAQLLARNEVVGPLEVTAVSTNPNCIYTAAANPNLSNLITRATFAATTGVLKYNSYSYTHRADPYDANPQDRTCFDELEQQQLGDRFPAVCTCTINNPSLADSAAVFTHSRIWNPNNSPRAVTPRTEGAAGYAQGDWAVPVLQNGPVLDTWMLVHRYQDIGFSSKCILLPGTINGEDNFKCRQTQIWVDREYQSNYNQWATLIPSYPYTQPVDSITAKERGITNIRSRDMYDVTTGTAQYDVAPSLDNLYPYLICQIPNPLATTIYDRGIPFAATDANGFLNLPAMNNQFNGVTSTFDRHQYCFVDGFRDRTAAESATAQRVFTTATAMFDNSPPERCSTYTNVGDVRLEAFDPDLADIPGPAEGTPVYSPDRKSVV